MKQWWLTILMVITLGLGPASDAFARQDRNDNAVESKAQAAEKARKEVNGRVLRVDQTRSAYRVKVLKKSGRVVSVDVDKRSGQVKPSDQRNSDR
ncbi:PepSY domain-containing protein [Alteromonas sp. H39]|uniref:PepSY domain-containing protein n=1 Tax=Alteromonas sp. H39 TaxID=3389876 RepID=UPI0039E087CA